MLASEETAIDWRTERTLAFGNKMVPAMAELIDGVIQPNDCCDLLLHAAIGNLLTTVAQIAELQGIDFADRRALLLLEKTVSYEIGKQVPRMLMEMVDAMKASAAEGEA